jgi:hypothetical protein
VLYGPGQSLDVVAGVTLDRLCESPVEVRRRRRWQPGQSRFA